MAKCPLWLQYHFINRVLYIFWNSSLPPDQQKDKSLQILNTCYFFDCSESRKFKDIKYDSQTRACISQKEFTLRVDLFPKCESIHFPHFFMSQHLYLWNGLFAQFSIGTLGVAAVNMGSWENPVSASNIITFHALFRADGVGNKTPTGSVTNLVLPSLEVIIYKNKKNSCKLLLCVFIIYYKL